MKKISGNPSPVVEVDESIRKMIQPITVSDLQAALEEARQELVGDILPERPAGGFTAKEFAESLGIPVATAAGILSRGVRANRYRTQKAYHRTDDNRHTPHSFYVKVNKEVTPCSTGQPSTISSMIQNQKSTKR